MTESTSPVGPGDRIAGKYRVDGVLGVGGMGVVVAATHEQLDQRVALKFLLPQVLARPEVVERFLREARAAVKIHSEHVARVLDVGTLESGAPYMVMEHLEGEDIEHLLERGGALPVAESVGYLLEACEAIAEAHAAGIVHRDLKPGNLFLAKRPSGRPIVKVLDFGISKVPITGKEQALTQAASGMGSPSYMSPEQFREARDADARSDIWSLGVVLYEMLTGKVPFGGDTMASLIVAVLHDPHPALAGMRADVPRALQAVVNRCLEKDPARRFADIAELARALCPFGPPRCEQSVERIEHVLAQAGAPVAMSPSRSQDVKAPTELAAAARTTRSSPQLGTRTLAPTSGSAKDRSRAGLWIVLPALVALAVAAVAVVHFLRPPAVTAPIGPASLQPAVSGAPSPTVLVQPAQPPSAAPTPSAEAPVPTAVALPSAHPHATAAVPAAVPSSPRCKIVTSFDADGNKHFKQQCP